MEVMNPKIKPVLTILLLLSLKSPSCSDRNWVTSNTLFESVLNEFITI